MKKIDKRDERKRAADEEAAAKRKEREAREAKEKEQTEFFAEFLTDWRCEQEFQNTEIPDDERMLSKYRRRIDYVARAIEARHELPSIIIEPYEGPTGWTARDSQYLVQVPIEKETFYQLKEEARNLNLSLDEYIRGVYYTTTYKENQKRIQKETFAKEGEYRNRAVQTSGFVPPDIRQALENTYGNPDFADNRFNSYFEELLQLARDHYHI